MDTTLSIAFLAGLISFLSPCVLPLIPGYISYINGQTLNNILDDGSKQEIQRKVLLKTILFSLGFSLIFISLGATASLIGQSFLNVNYYAITLAILHIFQDLKNEEKHTFHFQQPSYREVLVRHRINLLF